MIFESVMVTSTMSYTSGSVVKGRKFTPFAAGTSRITEAATATSTSERTFTFQPSLPSGNTRPALETSLPAPSGETPAPASADDERSLHSQLRVAGDRAEERALALGEQDVDRLRLARLQNRRLTRPDHEVVTELAGVLDDEAHEAVLDRLDRPDRHQLAVLLDALRDGRKDDLPLLLRDLDRGDRLRNGRRLGLRLRVG